MKSDQGFFLAASHKIDVTMAKTTCVQMGPRYFKHGERSLYLFENTYLHIELLDAERQIYDVSFSNTDFHVKSVKNDKLVPQRPWNHKFMIDLGAEGPYTIHGKCGTVIMTMQGLQNEERESVVDVSIVEQ